VTRDLVDALGTGSVETDSASLEQYARDWTGRFEQPASIAVRPRTREDVAAVLEICAATGTPVVPRGGGTGLVGGTLPIPDGVVLDLRSLGGLSIDAAGRTAIVGAGVTIAALRDAASRQGLTYGVDLASRDSATIGGTIATNAGGLLTLRNGSTRAQVLGVDVVLADGSIGSTARALARDNVGYHLPSLMTGSEGTLGVITAAALRLVPAPRSRSAALLAFDDLSACIAAAGVLGGLPAVESVEFMQQSGVDLVCQTASLRRPFRDPHGAYLLIGVAGQDDVTPVVTGLPDAVTGVADAAVALTEADRRTLWAYRERHTESIGTLGPVHKLDIALLQGDLAAFIGKVDRRIREGWPVSGVWIFGHAAEGSVHVNVTGVDAQDTKVDDCVLDAVLEVGGSISAEHGIGRAKLPWVNAVRSASETRTLRAIKQALDPGNRMNPGVLLPAG
jgi:FAD/FMN-containing dehydrogenase